MKAIIGAKKSTYKASKQFEGFAVIGGVKKVLNADVVKELREAFAKGEIEAPVTLWLNDEIKPISGTLEEREIYWAATHK